MTRPKRKRGKYHVDVPTKDDCLWCSKTVAAVSAFRCIGCTQAYHNKCAEQCGFLDSGAVGKCCDPASSAASQVNDPSAIACVSGNGSVSGSSDSDSEDEFACDGDVNSAVTKADLIVLLKSIKSTVKKSRKAMRDDLHEIMLSVNSAVEIANENKNAISALKSNFSNQGKLIEDISTKCISNEDSIKQLQVSMQNFQAKTNDYIKNQVTAAVSEVHKNVKSVDELYLEFNDRQSRRNKLMLFDVRDRNNVEDDHKFMESFLNKVGISDLTGVKFVRLGLFNSGKNRDKSRAIQMTFDNMEDYYKILNSKRTVLKGFNISTDKTLTQRERLKEVVNQVKEHNRSNPLDEKIIKYKFDVPTIADKPKNSKVDQRVINQN